jgi:hypothetical protein
MRKGSGRMYQPCRVCKEQHTNPRSSSICPDCGAAEAFTKSYEAAAALHEEECAAQDADERKRTELDNAETAHELREWIKEYML